MRHAWMPDGAWRRVGWAGSKRVRSGAGYARCPAARAGRVTHGRRCGAPLRTRRGNIGMSRLARYCAVPCAARRARRGARPRRAAATCGPDRRRQRVAGPARRGRWRGDKAGEGPSVPVSLGWYVLQHAACLSHGLRQALPLPRPTRRNVSGPAAWRRSAPGPRAGTLRSWIRRDRWTPRPAATAYRVVAACHPRPPQTPPRCPGHGRCPAPR